MPEHVDVDAAQSTYIWVRNAGAPSSPCVSSHCTRHAHYYTNSVSFTGPTHHSRRAHAVPHLEAATREAFPAQLMLRHAVAAALRSPQALGEVETRRLGHRRLRFLVDRRHGGLEAGEILETEVDGVVRYSEVKILQLLPRPREGRLVSHREELCVEEAMGA